MGTIYEKIKAASALKANAALISGAADAAPTYQDLSAKPVKTQPEMAIRGSPLKGVFCRLIVLSSATTLPVELPVIRAQ